jgi:thiol-disulfide isomerase/thioredoxin
MVRLLLTVLLCHIGWASAEHGQAGSPRPEAAAQWAAKSSVAKPLGIAASYDRQGRLWLARVTEGHLWVSHGGSDGQPGSAAIKVNPVAEAIAADGENRPRIAIAGDGTVHVVWSVNLTRPYTGHIRYSRSLDDGASFSAPVTINDDGAEIAHRFPALAVDGRHVWITWLDARRRKAAEAMGDAYAGSALYGTVSIDGGAQFGANRRLAEHSCECCGIGLVWQDDAPVALWRQIYGRNIRDFALARLSGTEAAPRRVSDDDWALDGCPHQGGGLAADTEGGLHLVWYTQGRTRQGLYYRRLDGDQSSPPMKFGNDEAQASHAAILAIGRDVTLVWREYDGQVYSIWGMRSTDRGATWPAPRRLAASLGASDLPQLAARGAEPWLIWNTAADGLIRLAVHNSADLPRPFEVETAAQFGARFAGRPYVLAFWSLDCPHCLGELRLLSRMRRTYPSVPIILVATDAADSAPRIAERLTIMGLGDAESWLFADVLPDRLRHTVDPRWRGELPRTYLYDAAHRMRAVTGVLDEAEFERWLSEQKG